MNNTNNTVKYFMNKLVAERDITLLEINIKANDLLWARDCITDINASIDFIGSDYIDSKSIDLIMTHFQKGYEELIHALRAAEYDGITRETNEKPETSVKAIPVEEKYDFGYSNDKGLDANENWDCGGNCDNCNCEEDDDYETYNDLDWYLDDCDCEFCSCIRAELGAELGTVPNEYKVGKTKPVEPTKITNTVKNETATPKSVAYDERATLSDDNYTVCSICRYEYGCAVTGFPSKHGKPCEYFSLRQDVKF